jgi:hypothetical protein
MKNIFIGLFILTSCFSKAQKFNKLPESKIQETALEAEMRFFASDEMLGRKTGSVTNAVAARYIAEELRAAGIKPVTGQSDYLQAVDLVLLKGPKSGKMTVGNDTLFMAKQMVAFGGSDEIELANLPVVFAAYGWKNSTKGTNDYKDLDVKGKIVITRAGNEDAKSPQDFFTAATEKRKFAKEEGAAAIIEIFNAAIPWPSVAAYFSGENISLASDIPKEKRVPLYWVAGNSAKNWTKENITQASISIPKREIQIIKSSNVVGVLEGSDPVLKNEYVIASAHFDHIGSGKAAGRISDSDSIFNGTRDNAFGTLAVLNAARSLAIIKPKRSILFLGFTGEEVGLLGSKYYAENPLVPLKQCIYNLNCDGAGYNDTQSLVLIGLGRTDADVELSKASAQMGLKLIADPAPEQGLFDRSDNVSFAARGIPAPTYSPGFTAFDDAIYKYYHQAADNPNTIDYTYFKKYIQTYIYSLRLIANRSTKPKWTPGDKYEPAFNSLYK